MPNCFQLIDRTTGEAESLNKIDEQICELLGRPVHSRDYVENWFDTIGFEIAMGTPLESPEMDKFLTTKWPHREHHAKILAFLRERYGSDAWCQRH
jgi:hypothetical protein